MAIETIIARYGLAAIFLGAGVEGEAVVVTGGVLAHAGLFPLWQAAIAATLGSCLVDQLWFGLARRFRDSRWVQAAARKPAFARAIGILERWPNSFIFGFRFIYGLRTVSPIAIGTSRIPAAKFVPLNALSAMIWAPVFTVLGYALGKAAGPFLSDVQSVGYGLAGGIVALVVLAVAIGYVRRRRAQAGGPPFCHKAAVHSPSEKQEGGAEPVAHHA
jgi:membrane protein DedA with SNARE-associated domain